MNSIEYGVMLDLNLKGYTFFLYTLYNLSELTLYRVSQKTRKLLKSLIVKIECPTKKLNVMDA
jgi:hypothetical protein